MVQVSSKLDARVSFFAPLLLEGHVRPGASLTAGFPHHNWLCAAIAMMVGIEQMP
jgi:hypothetical protein